MNCPEGYALAGGVCVAEAFGGGSGPMDSQPYFVGSLTSAAATTSGIANLIVVNAANLVTLTGSPPAAGRAYVFPLPFTITRVVIQSDTGPGGVATLNLTLLIQPFVVGTPFTVAGYATLDSAITATASGSTPMNANITAFAAGSGVAIPAGTGIVWQSITGGGVASTAQVITNMQIYGVWG